MTTEPTTIGLSEDAHRRLLELERDHIFERLIDGYRFAVALALAWGGIADETTSRRTIFNVGSLDPDGNLYAVVSSLRSSGGEPVYRTMERLAEWGVNELARMAESGDISFGELLSRSNELSQ